MSEILFGLNFGLRLKRIYVLFPDVIYLTFWMFENTKVEFFASLCVCDVFKLNYLNDTLSFTDVVIENMINSMNFTYNKNLQHLSTEKWALRCNLVFESLKKKIWLTLSGTRKLYLYC